MTTTARNVVVTGNSFEPSGATFGTPVYVLGALGFDFGTVQNRELFYAANGGKAIITNTDLALFLASSMAPESDIDALNWTLVVDGTPIYALQTSNHGGLEKGLKSLLLDVIGDPSIDCLSVPGIIRAEVTLLDGRVVPVIDPDFRGICKWSSQAIARTVALTGKMSLPPPTLNLTRDARSPEPNPVDWEAFHTTPPVRKKTGGGLISELSPIGVGGSEMLTPYANSTIGMTWDNGDGSTEPPDLVFGGTAASCAAGGLQFTATANSTPRTLRIYARTFASTGRLSVTMSDGSSPDYVNTSFNAFPSIAGLPGVVDGTYTIVYRAKAASPTTVTVRFIGTPTTAVTANPLAVTLFAGTGGAGSKQDVNVGAYPESAITTAVNRVGSVHVPPGLRLSVYNQDVVTSPPTAEVVGKTFLGAPHGIVVDLTPPLLGEVRSLIVEPDNYVGIQAVSLKLWPIADAPLIPFDSDQLLNFTDRVYYLLRNSGLSAQERAINYAATQLVLVGSSASTTGAMGYSFANAVGAGLGVEAISAEPSLGARPGSDCWDVKFAFFDAMQGTQAVRTYVRFTVDVSNVRPITIAPARSWTAF